MDRRVGRRTFLSLAVTAISTAGSLAGRPRARPPAPPSFPLAAVAAQPGPARLSYVEGSTAKIEQVIGDYDKGLQAPTLNQTQRRYGVIGTDLGNTFEHAGRIHFCFGDTIGPGAYKPLASSASSDPDAPLAIDFVSDAPGSFVPMRIPGVSLGPYEVPVSGLSLDGGMYVVVSTNYSPATPTDRSVLARFDETTRSFTAIREISRLPGGHFIKMTLRLAPDGVAGIAVGEPHVLIFGSGVYRRSNVYLAAVPAQGFESGEGTRYFAGLAGGEPVWSGTEGDALPIVVHPVVGDLSVVYAEQAGLWLMTYDSRNPQGIVLRYAPQPWGPWSEAVIIFNPRRDAGVGTFLHNPRQQPDDGLDGPVAVNRDPARVAGGAYAPLMLERFLRVQDDTLELQYLMSTWNPYTVVRMRSALSITH
jgi:hypothetical protein